MQFRLVAVGFGIQAHESGFAELAQISGPAVAVGLLVAVERFAGLEAAVAVVIVVAAQHSVAQGLVVAARADIVCAARLLLLGFQLAVVVLTDTVHVEFQQFGLLELWL